MNCASARCRRASWPRSTVKRAPRQLRRGVAIEPAVARAEFDVVLDREIERARRAPAVLFDVVRSRRRPAAPTRAAGSGCRARSPRSRARMRPGATSRGLELVAEAGDFGHQRRDVLALRLGLADRLAARVAQVLQFLGAHLQSLALGFQRSSAATSQVEAAGFAQARGEFGGLGTQQVGIEHGDDRLSDGS